ncbi:MAG TPA: hypothetical protein VMW35_09420 [Myxococcota bacterium]|nr:hypothetical protein [Myxococcota bacterium]
MIQIPWSDDDLDRLPTDADQALLQFTTIPQGPEPDLPPGGIVVRSPLPRPLVRVTVDGRDLADFHATIGSSLAAPRT